MVRINFRASLKTILCFFSLSLLSAETRKDTKKRIVSQEKPLLINNSDVAKTSLEEIVLEADGKLDKSGKKLYQYKAHIKKLEINANQEALGKEISLSGTINQINLSATISSIFIRSYFNANETYYLFDATQSQITFAGIIIASQSIIADTGTKVIFLHQCTGSYDSKNEMFGILQFYTSQPIIIKNMSLYSSNLQITNEKVQIDIAQIILNQEQGKAKKILAKIDDFIISIEEMNMRSKINLQSKFINKIIAKNIKCLRKSDKTEISSGLAEFENDKLTLPQAISIKTKNFTLTAANGYQEGKKIFLKKINFKTKNANGFSQSGYFDIKHKKLILENGKIEWQSSQAKI